MRSTRAWFADRGSDERVCEERCEIHMICPLPAAPAVAERSRDFECATLMSVLAWIWDERNPIQRETFPPFLLSSFHSLSKVNGKGMCGCVWKDCWGYFRKQSRKEKRVYNASHVNKEKRERAHTRALRRETMSGWVILGEPKPGRPTVTPVKNNEQKECLFQCTIEKMD